MAAKIIVLDNSINTRLLWPDSESPASNRYASDVLSQAINGSVFHVPTIWHYEAAHVAAKLVPNGQVSQASAMSYFEQIALLPIVTDVSSHANAARATFALSIQFGLPCTTPPIWSWCSAWDAAWPPTTSGCERPPSVPGHRCSSRLTPLGQRRPGLGDRSGRLRLLELALLVAAAHPGPPSRGRSQGPVASGRLCRRWAGPSDNASSNAASSAGNVSSFAVAAMKGVGARRRIRQSSPMTRADDPFDRFRDLFERASATGLTEPNAMVLSSADEQGRPSSRVVLLKHFDRRGFVFYTNLESRKGREILARPDVSLNFFWREPKEQVCVLGRAERVGDAEADAYFATRDRNSQLGAWASRQSRPLASREQLLADFKRVSERFAGRDVPRPPHWTGLRVVPRRFEFWVAREHRLHDRTFHERDGDSWRSGVLYP